MEVAAALVPVAAPTDVAEARRRTDEVCRVLAFDAATAGRAALVATEAATNLLKHAGRGEVFVGPAGPLSGRGLQIIAIDRGAGIPDLERSLRDGYSTAGTSGTGLGAIRRAADTFDVYSDKSGTVLAATVHPEELRRFRTRLSFGGLSVPAPGERVCGDAWAAWEAGELISVFVCDGLGHGPEAAAAAAIAVGAFHRHAERSATAVIGAVHDALKSTRGAALAIAELDGRHGTLRYCGLGNISAVVIRPDGREQHLVSLAGIAGHIMRRLQAFTYEWPRGSTLVMHTDGVGTHWSLGKYGGLARRRPDAIAGVLYRDHRRGRDDTTAVAACNGERV